MAEAVPAAVVPAAAPVTPAATTPVIPAAAAPAVANVLNAPAAAEPVVTAPATWPEDWRLKMAGGDDKLAKRLERFASPDLVAKSWLTADGKINAGALKPVAPAADATPEAVTAWRKDNGIPEKAEGYLALLDKGLVIGEQDKPIVDAFLASAHAAHLDPAAVRTALGFHYQNQQNLQAARVELDKAGQVATEEELRAEYGAEYRRNVNIISAYLDTAPKGVKDIMLNARGPDGVALANTPNVVRWLLGAAMEANPAASVVPGASASAGVGIAERKTAIEKMMPDGKSDYWKGPNAINLQTEYRNLLEAEERLGARSRAA